MAHGKVLLIGLLATFAFADGAAAREAAPSRADSFAIGTGGSVCDAQGVAMGDARESMFDRKWVILCRDVARPVGAAYLLRGGAEALPRIAAARTEKLSCGKAGPVALEGGGSAQASDCRAAASGLAWKSYRHAAGRQLYVVEGLSGYDGALRLALRNLIADRIVPGDVEVATTGASGGSLSEAMRAVVDPRTLIGLGYRSNNAGAYVEAAELFAPVTGESAGGGLQGGAEQTLRFHEMIINRALQLSNLGEFAQAARLFAEARAMRIREPVQDRLSRNYRAIDALNQNDLEGVLTILDEPVEPLAHELVEGGALRIDSATAAGLNAAPGGQLAGVIGYEARLSAPERAAIIDAQGEQLRGTVYRLSGRLDEARLWLSRAMEHANGVREGRVLSTVRLNAQILSELALADEAKGDFSAAEDLLRRALQLVEAQYPDSASVNNARARLAGFLARHGQRDEARAIFGSIVQAAAGNRNALVGMTNLIRPYFDLLVEDAPGDPQLLPDLFLVSQLVERPGAADAMEQLARRLEGGDAAASALFRQSQEVARELERTRIQIARQSAAGAAGGAGPALDELGQRQRRLLDTQVELMAALADYPQYRAVSNRTVALDEMRALLRPGEAYLKLVQLGGALYAVYVSRDAARGWRVERSATEIADLVTALRATISLSVAGNQQTYPFDVDTAADLYDALLGPVAGDLAAVHLLMFEPDGAMLKLPLNLLTGDRTGIAAYHRRTEAGGDPFDFTGIAWLGRTTAVSTVLSAATFRDARRAPASQASRDYLGLGENLPLGPVTALPSVRGAAGEAQAAGCSWPVATWNRPISARELREASAMFGRGQADLMIDGQFTDTAVMARDDLASYRVIHFATHGLVTAPREGCPARPALLTSFGGAGSDGLLGFSEIFDLRLDADLVILSACDTAAQASVEATREAGVSTGGGEALDGLVRAFIAAGGRQVIASHWPAPDDYGATRRLFSGFFTDRDDSVAGALQHAQLALMDDPRTSHPFYWAGFAIVGDGSRALWAR
jgi:CHAT domain-containing protein